MSASLQETVTIQLGDRSYPILIASGLIQSEQAFRHLKPGSTALIVSNSVVWPLYGQPLSEYLEKCFGRVLRVGLPDGEEYKTQESVNTIFDTLLSHACDRKTLLFALGGGVIGDMTGFAAACYMRGIPFVQVPTTLLAQVDSSVGGKTGINHPMGKNMIGAFYQPQMVICDVDTLKTLPDREISAGLAEVIKYGPIADLEFYRWIEHNIDALLRREEAALVHAIKRSCEIKAMVVSQDERESGIRAILNFGHTFGHAIEAGMGYGKWLHGEAVGCGMVMAAHLSHKLGLLPLDEVSRLKALIAKAGLPVVGPILDLTDNAGRYLELMRVDKKSDAGSIRYVVIDGKGNASMQPAPDALVREVINACCL